MGERDPNPPLFLLLKRSKPMLSNFSTPLTLVVGLVGWCLKPENDIGLSMLSTDIAGDSALPGDKAHEDFELLYDPASELALLIAVFSVNRFTADESPFMFAILDSEVPLRGLLNVVVAALECSTATSVFLGVVFPASGSESIEFLEEHECLLEEKDLAFSSSNNLPGAMLL